MVTLDSFEETLDALDDLDPGDLVVVVMAAGGFVPGPKCSFLLPTCPIWCPLLGVSLPFAHIEEGVVPSDLQLLLGGENGKATNKILMM